MEITTNHIKSHPFFLDALFAFKSTTSTVFKDVLGLHNLDHIALTQITRNTILTFSSTPAIEFNLFNSNLWRFDKTYDPHWFSKCRSAEWGSLYTKACYDELYYLKQKKPHYPLGYSYSVKQNDSFLIYSFASHNEKPETRALFTKHNDDFYKIGQYCSKHLSKLFIKCDGLQPSL